ncbi:hypothetical protein FNF27_07549 [Cafeteria roenbergensis]|uniref:Uncharacterized protein n=1 Tax=Cafeteria roenbergensis TaxID=33653 RepID=A0A5A8C2B3_CAFRO|nr:hypothetical protein FNF31_07683 [Cafeteria roenbergensis]KAA0166057.1 hypothetical protein FNF27_07549 [Cafeteria roenbergensis]
MAAARTSAPSSGKALWEAAYVGSPATVARQLDAGAPVNCRFFTGYTPLAVAAHLGHIRAVRVLLDRGADLEAKNDFGHTPVQDAAANGHGEVVCALLDRGADLEARDSLGSGRQRWYGCWWSEAQTRKRRTALARTRLQAVWMTLLPS